MLRPISRSLLAAIVVLAVVGGPGKAQLQFDEPTGVAADSTGNLHVADSGNARIQVQHVAAGERPVAGGVQDELLVQLRFVDIA